MARRNGVLIDETVAGTSPGTPGANTPVTRALTGVGLTVGGMGQRQIANNTGQQSPAAPAITNVSDPSPRLGEQRDDARPNALSPRTPPAPGTATPPAAPSPAPAPTQPAPPANNDRARRNNQGGGSGNSAGSVIDRIRDSLNINPPGTRGRANGSGGAGGSATPQPAPAPATAPPPTTAGAYAGVASSTVADRVNALLGKDSDLLRRAGQKGLNLANKRGLLNSSIAVEASMAAMMDAIVPIASQDSQQAYGQMLQEMINVHAKSMQEMQIGSTEKIAAAARASSEKIAAEGNATSKEVAASNNAAQAEREAAQIAAQAALREKELAAQKELAVLNNAAAKEVEIMRLEFQSAANAAQLNQADKTALTNALANANATYAQTQSAIYANTAMDAFGRTNALGAAKAAYLNQIALLERQYGVSLNVGTAPSGVTPTPLPAAPGTAA